MAEGQTKARRDTVLDVTEEQIARTYATAFLASAEEQGPDQALASVEELEAFCGEVLNTHPLFEGMLGSAFLDHPRRVELFDRLLAGKVSATTVNLLKVLSAHDRVGIVRTVARLSRRLYNERSNLAEVLVRVATPIDDDTLDHVKGTIRNQTGKEPLVRVEIVPELVGGLEVRIGDTVYDGTLRTAFDKAHKAIVEQTVQAIETNPERFTLAS